MLPHSRGIREPDPLNRASCEELFKRPLMNGFDQGVVAPSIGFSRVSSLCRGLGLRVTTAPWLVSQNYGRGGNRLRPSGLASTRSRCARRLDAEGKPLDVVETPDSACSRDGSIIQCQLLTARLE